MKSTKIEWTESTWNPVTGCPKVSSGCKNCYAEPMSNRLKAMGDHKYSNGFSLTLHPESLNQPYNWKKPRLIFVNSMSDLFHPEIPDKFIEDVFNTMNNTRHHIYQVLTKRSERLKELSSKLIWTDNIWMGVTIEESGYLYRMDDLKEVSSSIRFLSLEPLLGDLGLIKLDGIHWVIVGGESGPGARIMKEEWVNRIKEQCVSQNVLFFFKQWGGVQKKKAGRMLDNKTWDDMPEIQPLFGGSYGVQ